MAYTANKKPGELTALTSLAANDVFVVGDISDTVEVAKYITKSNLAVDLFASPTFTGTVTVPVGLTGVLRADTGVLSVETTALVDADIGSTVQAYDADLTTWAGITPGTGVGTALAVAVGSAGALVTNGGALGTPSSGTLTNCTGLPVNGIVDDTSSALGVGTVELGHATDTTLSRSAAGVLAVEGVTVPTISSTNTLTNKRITKRVGSTTSSATPTIDTDSVDAYHLTAQAADITSFTTNLSGTPTDFQTLVISVTGTAARAITWGASFENGPVALPTTTVTTTRLDVLFMWNSVSSKWRCMATGSTV